MIDISIIIPTLNEEKYLPKLLESIKKQNYNNYEIIVSDANSKDKTREIAKKFGCKIVKGGLPSVARNNGAKIAKGEIIIFFDSDVILCDNFLRENLKEFEKRNLGIATTCVKPLSKKLIDYFIVGFVPNSWMFITQKFSPHAPGFSIFVKKKIHEKIKGFDETIKIAEDHDYVKRASKVSKFGLLMSKKILVSVRRFDKEGRFKLSIKYIYFTFLRLFKGEIREEKDYEFGNY